MARLLLLVMAVAAQLTTEVASDIGGPPLSGNIPDAVPENGNEGLDSVRDNFYAQCRAQGISDPEALVRGVGESAQTCVRNNLNMTEIQAEITRHMDNGELDVLFSGRCRSLPPILLDCAEQQLTRLTACLNETERARDHPGTLMAGLRAAVDFLCYQGGERIAIFLGDKGQECVSANRTRDSVQGCLRAHNLTEGAADLLGGLTFGFTPANCRRLFVAHDCVAAGLRTCEDSTPSNVVDSLLRAFEKPLPCRRATGAAPPPPLADCLMLLVSTAAALLLGRRS